MRELARQPAKTLPAVLLVAAAAFAAGCIERAPTPQSRREKFDRSSLEQVLLREAPAPARRVGANFGDVIELVGVDFSPARPKPGDTVEVTTYYRVLDQVDEDYKVFVHIEDRAARADRKNGDHWPAQGKYPTGAWRRGEVVKDAWTFKVPGYFDGEALDLWTGFYQPGKDDRLPLQNRGQVQNDGQNRVLAASVPVGR